jgi:hypothetical protein
MATESFFTLKFFDSGDSKFKFELDFNYPFTTNDASQKLQQQNVSIEPGQLQAVMNPMFDKLKLFLKLVDDLATNKEIAKHFEGACDLKGIIKNFDQLKVAFDALKGINDQKGIKQISINRVSYALFNPQELNISTNFSVNGDMRPPK